jgi:hypothetical protein
MTTLKEMYLEFNSDTNEHRVVSIEEGRDMVVHWSLKGEGVTSTKLSLPVDAKKVSDWVDEYCSQNHDACPWPLSDLITHIENKLGLTKKQLEVTEIVVETRLTEAIGTSLRDMSQFKDIVFHGGIPKPLETIMTQGPESFVREELRDIQGYSIQEMVDW